MPHKIEFELEDEDFEKICHFKKVFDVVMDEETEIYAIPLLFSNNYIHQSFLLEFFHL